MDRYIALYLFSDARRRGSGGMLGGSSSNGGIGIQPPSSEEDEDDANEVNRAARFIIPYGHDVDINYEVVDDWDSPPPPTDDGTTPDHSPPPPMSSGNTTPRIDVSGGNGKRMMRGGPAIGWAELYDSDVEDAILMDKMKEFSTQEDGADGGGDGADQTINTKAGAAPHGVYAVKAPGYAFDDDVVEDAEGAAIRSSHNLDVDVYEPDVWVRGDY